MQVKVIKGGCACNGKLATAGAVIDVSDAYGKRLVASGIAESLEKPKAQPKVKKKQPEPEAIPDLTAEDPIL